jgi:hypothetical protein
MQEKKDQKAQAKAEKAASKAAASDKEKKKTISSHDAAYALACRDSQAVASPTGARLSRGQDASACTVGCYRGLHAQLRFMSTNRHETNDYSFKIGSKLLRLCYFQVIVEMVFYDAVAFT